MFATAVSRARWLGIAAAAMALLAIPASAHAVAGTDLTTGSAAYSPASGFVFTVTVDASSTDGASPKGKLTFDYVTPTTSFTRTGKVTCHIVSGYTATVGAVFKKPATLAGGQVVTGVVVFIEDDTPIGGIDDLTWSFVAQGAQVTCPPPFSQENNVTSGDYQVTDG
jgi:hypothetical protein